MKITKFVFAVLLLMSMFTANVVTAKGKITPDVYLFGFSASFQDSVVYITEIQKLDSAWIDSKTKFLLSRENYSHQLKNYLNNKHNLPHRTCIVMFDTKKKDIEKKYSKLKNKYLSTKNENKFDIKVLDSDMFKFEYIDMSYEESYNDAK